MKKRILAMVMLLLILLSSVACKKDDGGNETGGGTVNTADDDYDYADVDYQDSDFTFLNLVEGDWGMTTALAPDDLTNDEISDAVFKRNQKIKDIYNVNIKQIEQKMYDTTEFVQTQCLTGDSTVDVAFVVGEGLPTLMASGYLTDISTNSKIQYFEPWWNQLVRESSQFGGSASFYYAFSDISLTFFDLTWCVSVNLDMISEYQLENPYQLVKDGKWTIDKMFEMAKVAVKPNDDGSFDYSEASKCEYGFATHAGFTTAGINGAGLFMVTKNEMSLPTFSASGERFIDVVEKYAEQFATPGVAITANEDNRTYHYEDIFRSDRVLFAGCEVKSATYYRTSEMAYGILPVPKYDEDQESYYSNINYLTPALVIPITNDEADKTGTILDAMAYLSYKDIMPVYYERALSLRALRDPDSQEMLNIIRDTRVTEVSLVYGWTKDFEQDLKYVFCAKVQGTGVASLIAKHRTSINKQINSYVESFT